MSSDHYQMKQLNPSANIKVVEKQTNKQNKLLSGQERIDSDSVPNQAPPHQWIWNPSEMGKEDYKLHFSYVNSYVQGILYVRRDPQ